MSDFVIENGVITKYTGKEKILKIPEEVSRIAMQVFASDVLLIAGGAGILVMGRILLGLSAAQGFGTLVDNRAVPIGLAQHG